MVLMMVLNVGFLDGFILGFNDGFIVGLLLGASVGFTVGFVVIGVRINLFIDWRWYLAVIGMIRFHCISLVLLEITNNLKNKSEYE